MSSALQQTVDALPSNDEIKSGVALNTVMTLAETKGGRLTDQPMKESFIEYLLRATMKRMSIYQPISRKYYNTPSATIAPDTEKKVSEEKNSLYNVNGECFGLFAQFIFAWIFASKKDGNFMFVQFVNCLDRCSLKDIETLLRKEVDRVMFGADYVSKQQYKPVDKRLTSKPGLFGPFITEYAGLVLKIATGSVSGYLGAHFDMDNPEWSLPENPLKHYTRQFFCRFFQDFPGCAEWCVVSGEGRTYNSEDLDAEKAETEAGILLDQLKKDDKHSNYGVSRCMHLMWDFNSNVDKVQSIGRYLNQPQAMEYIKSHTVGCALLIDEP